MNKEKVKRFVKEHKREIIVGTVCVATGIAIGKKRAFRADERKLVEELRRFNPIKGKDSIFNDIDEVLKRSDDVRIFSNNGRGTVGQIGDVVDYYYKDKLDGLDTKCTGVIVLTK